MTEPLLLSLKISVAVLIFAIGMGSTVSDLSYLTRRPGLLIRSLLAMYVCVPVSVLLLVTLLPLSPAVKAALLVLAVSAGAPLLPKKLGALGSDEYVFSLVVLSSLLAIVLVPAWIAVLSRHFGVSVDISAVTVAIAIAKAFMLPLALGMLIRALWRGYSETVSDRLISGAGIVLAASGALLLASQWEIFLDMKWQGMLALFSVMLVALAIGHALGGPRPDDRTALAVACATRHVGIAVLVATAFPGPRTAVLIAAYVIASLGVSLPYLQWRSKRRTRPRSGA